MMRRLFITSLIMMLIIFLTGCTSKEDITIEDNQMIYKLKDTEKNGDSTIYQFESSTNQVLTITKSISGEYVVNLNNREYKIIGNTVSLGDSTCTITGSSETCFNTNDIDFSFRAREVFELIQNNEFEVGQTDANAVNGWMLFLGFILIIIGIIRLRVPKLTWFLNDGWRFKKVEPSDFYLDFIRLFGIIFIVSGIVLIIMEFI
jgi:hypothetical protein